MNVLNKVSKLQVKIPINGGKIQLPNKASLKKGCRGSKSCH